MVWNLRVRHCSKWETSRSAASTIFVTVGFDFFNPTARQLTSKLVIRTLHKLVINIICYCFINFVVYDHNGSWLFGTPLDLPLMRTLLFKRILYKRFNRKVPRNGDLHGADKGNAIRKPYDFIDRILYVFKIYSVSFRYTFQMSYYKYFNLSFKIF